MALASIAEIKRLGNIKDSDNIEAADFTAAIKAGDGWVLAITGRADWSSVEDPLYFDTLANIANLYATYTFLISFDKDEYLDKAKEVRAAFDSAVKTWREIPLPDADVDTTNFAVASSEYTTRPLNPNAPVFLSDY